MKIKSSSLASGTTEKAANTAVSEQRKPFTGAPLAQQVKREKHLRCTNPENQMQKRTEAVNMFTANGDTSKRWYVSYYAGEPLKRVRVYGCNHIKDPVERLAELKKLRSKIMESGMHLSSKTPVKSEFSTGELSKIYLLQKQRRLRRRSYTTYRDAVQPFIKWLAKVGLDEVMPGFLDNNIMNSFVDHLLQSGVSNRTVNNYMSHLRTFFRWCKKHYRHAVGEFTLDYDKLPSSSESHVAYTDQEARQISDYLKSRDKDTWLFTKFIVYPFLRVNEVIGVKVGDIDIENKKLLLTAETGKASRREFKPLPSIFIDDLLEAGVMNYPKDYYVFTKSGVPGPIKTTNEKYRERFKKVKKHLGFSSKHTMYGLRHTFVCQLIRNGMPALELMKYTGHTTLSSFEKYLRSILSGEAADISDKYSVRF